jgi:hypothetical protein
MDRQPYPAHLCAADPAGWAAGFERAAAWIVAYGPSAAASVYRAVRDSSGQPWPVTARRLGWPATAEREGLALGIYGLEALARQGYGTRPPGHPRDVEVAGPAWRSEWTLRARYLEVGGRYRRVEDVPLPGQGPAFVWNGRSRGPDGARFQLGWCSYCRGPAERGPSGAWFHLTPGGCPYVDDLLGVLGLLPGQGEGQDEGQHPEGEQAAAGAAEQDAAGAGGGDPGHQQGDG